MRVMLSKPGERGHTLGTLCGWNEFLLLRLFQPSRLVLGHSADGHFMPQMLYCQTQIEIFFLAIAGKKIVSDRPQLQELLATLIL